MNEKKRYGFSRLSVATVLILVTVTAVAASASQRSRKPNRQGRGAASLSEPFVGVTTDGKPQPGLFKIKSTGVSTEPVVTAANKFLAGLAVQQRQKTTFPVDDLEWRKWENRHRGKRQGVSFEEMSPEQRELAFGLLKASLSAKGLQLSQDIMKLNHTLAELTENFDAYGQWLYWITIMGQPSESEPWGWQIEGHHLAINYFVLGDQVVMSPVFIGSEPVKATNGKFKGTEILQREQDLGLAFMQSLSEPQQAKATLAKLKNGNNALAQAYHDNLKLDFAGLKLDQLTPAQRQHALNLIGSYIGNMREGHAKVTMAEIEEHLDETWFAWVGDSKPDSVFYYRVHSPVILIEFDHERRVAPFRSDRPTRDHIHAVIRTPNGNDYGKDLLRQHIELHHQ